MTFCDAPNKRRVITSESSEGAVVKPRSVLSEPPWTVSVVLAA